MPDPRAHRYVLIAALGCSALGVLALLMPLPPMPGWQWLLNLAHVPLLAALAWLWLRALGSLGMDRRRALAVVLLGGATAGGAMELLQCYVPGRWPDWKDFALNLLGLILGAWLAWRSDPR